MWKETSGYYKKINLILEVSINSLIKKQYDCNKGNVVKSIIQWFLQKYVTFQNRLKSHKEAIVRQYFQGKDNRIIFFERVEIQITGICDGIGLILFIFAIFFFILIALVTLISLFGFAVVDGWLIYNGVKILKKQERNCIICFL